LVGIIASPTFIGEGMKKRDREVYFLGSRLRSIFRDGFFSFLWRSQRKNLSFSRFCEKDIKRAFKRAIPKRLNHACDALLPLDTDPFSGEW
jgi:hypothetical protein